MHSKENAFVRRPGPALFLSDGMVGVPQMGEKEWLLNRLKLDQDKL